MLSQMLQSAQDILAEGQHGDNKGPLLSHLYLPVFSAGQLQCNLTSLHLEDFAQGHMLMMSGSLLHFAYIYCENITNN